MTTTRESLSRLRAAERSPVGGQLGLALDSSVELQGLIREVEALEQTVTRQALPSRTALAEAKSRWASEGRIQELSARHIRALCWDADSATSPGFVRAVEHHPDLPRNRRWIEGLVTSYLARWRTMPEPQILETILQHAVAGFSGRSERLERYRGVAREMFSKNAPQWLAAGIIADRRRIDETLDEWKIDRSSGLGEAVANATVEEWLQRFNMERRALRSVAAFGCVRQLLEELLASPLVGPNAIARSVSALILWDQAERDERIHEALRTFLLEDPRFRDPRLPNRSPVWDLCDPEARQRAIGWLAKSDLTFFFEFVIRTDPHQRRAFWLRYIQRAVDAHVALSDEDAYRLRAEVKEKLSYSKVLRGQGTSAFLMRFHGASKDILCIEFSKVGNALYVHDADTFVERFGSIRRPHFDLNFDLKNYGSLLEKFTHHASTWQMNVMNFLSRHGIRPS